MSLFYEESPEWSKLITMQQEQLRLLAQLMKERIAADGDSFEGLTGYGKFQ